jgi:hypothetical protein
MTPKERKAHDLFMKGLEQRAAARKKAEDHQWDVAVKLNAEDYAVMYKKRDGTAGYRRSPMKRQSTTVSRPGRLSRAQEERLYSGLAKTFVARHRREGKLCPVMLEIFNTKKPVTSVHHQAGREGRLLLAQEHWMAVSAKGHNWIHTINPAEARKRGWLYRVDQQGRIRRR